MPSAIRESPINVADDEEQRSPRDGRTRAPRRRSRTRRRRGRSGTRGRSSARQDVRQRRMLGERAGARPEVRDHLVRQQRDPGGDRADDARELPAGFPYGRARSQRPAVATAYRGTAASGERVDGVLEPVARRDGGVHRMEERPVDDLTLSGAAVAVRLRPALGSGTGRALAPECRAGTASRRSESSSPTRHEGSSTATAAASTMRPAGSCGRSR